MDNLHPFLNFCLLKMVQWYWICHAFCICYAAKLGQAGKGYVPNTDRREVQKMNTQAMYQDWQDAYVSQLQDHPDKGKKWHSRMIARMLVARGRDSEQSAST